MEANTITQGLPLFQVPGLFRIVAGRRYVYGLRGIMHLFGVSNVTAQRYKNGIIKDAVIQNRRKIIVDVDRAVELYNAALRQQERNIIERVDKVFELYNEVTTTVLPDPPKPEIDFVDQL